MKNLDWFKLDNAAKSFPSRTNQKNNNTFFLACVLKEDVVPEALNAAVRDVLGRFPTFKVRLKRGVFWYYFEENNKPFLVKPEMPNLLNALDEKENNDYLFEVLYYKQKITLIIHHALTDGMGGMEFLKALIYQYLKLRGFNVSGEGDIMSVESPATDKETEDTAPDCMAFSSKSVYQKDPFAYKITGTPFDYDGCSFMVGKLKVDQLKEITKAHGVSITCYISALLLYATVQLYMKNKKVENNLAGVIVPVNMRKLQKSCTMRNFVAYIRVYHEYIKDVTFEEILQSCKQQMEEKLAPEKLIDLVASNARIEKNFFLRIAPLFIKDIAINLAYSRLGDNLHSTCYSNLGVVNIPASIKKHVVDFLFLQYVNKGAKFNICTVSYDDHINIIFSRLFRETDFEKFFFRHFTSLGIDVEITSNYWEKRL